MRDTPRLGAKVRALRRRESLSQVQLAERLGISASYLNLIEHDRRPLNAGLLIKLGQILPVDLKSLAANDEARLTADLMEALGDPLFEGHALAAPDVMELATASPSVSRAVLALYQAYRGARESADMLAARLSEGDELHAIDSSPLPSEEVSDLIQRRGNHFPELEEGAEMLWSSGLLSGDLY